MHNFVRQHFLRKSKTIVPVHQEQGEDAKYGQNPTAKNPLYSVSKLNAQTEMQDIVFF